MLLPALTQSQQPTTTQATRYTTQLLQFYNSQLQQPPQPQPQSHSPSTYSDVSVEFTRSAPLNHSHPAAPILFPALTTITATTAALSQSSQPPVFEAIAIMEAPTGNIERD
jgi:hypothetical protein